MESARLSSHRILTSETDASLLAMLDSRPVVEVLDFPAVLVGQDLRAVAYSPRWVEDFGEAFCPLAEAPFDDLPGVASAARTALETGDPTQLTAPETLPAIDRFEMRPVVSGEPGALRVVSGLLIVAHEQAGAGSPVSGWHRQAVEIGSTPTFLVGPRGRVLFANRAAAYLGTVQRLDDLGGDAQDAPRLFQALAQAVKGTSAVVGIGADRDIRFLPLTGLALVEVIDHDALPNPAAVPMFADMPGLEAFSFRVRSDLQDLVGHLEMLRQTSLSRLQQARLDCAVERAMELVAHLGEPGPAPPDDAHPTLPPRRAPDAPPLRVLVVDDNSINLHVAASMFNVLGLTVDTARTGAEALAKLGEATYDLVFMDVMLPEVDGMEVTQQIRARFGPRPYVVGVTAMPNVQDQCLSAGMDAFFMKPLRLEEVSRAVELCEAG